MSPSLRKPIVTNFLSHPVSLGRPEPAGDIVSILSISNLLKLNEIAIHYIHAVLFWGTSHSTLSLKSSHYLIGSQNQTEIYRNLPKSPEKPFLPPSQSIAKRSSLAAPSSPIPLLMTGPRRTFFDASGGEDLAGGMRGEGGYPGHLIGG